MARVPKKSEEARGRVPPQNIEAEQSLLGGLLVDSEAINKVVDIVSPEDFYKDAHGRIYGIILDLYEKNEAIDILTVASAARDKGIIDRVGGITYLNTLVDMMPSAANIAHYARMVREKGLTRNLIDAATQIIELGHDAEMQVDGLIDEAERLVFTVSENKVKQPYFALKDVVRENVKTIEMLHVKKQSITGVSTGFTDIDRMTSGLQPSDLIVVAGRPSMGKTALCMNMALNIATSGIPVGIFSLEMSKEQLVTRLLSAESEIEHGKLRTGSLSSAELPRLFQAASRLSEATMFIDDAGALSVLELRARARRMKKEHGLGFVIVDYLQLMKGRNTIDRREQEISEISRFMKSLAKELHIPVIAISQLNRMVEQREDRRPRLSDLRESGAIEQDADVIMFIYRDEVYNKSPDNPNKGIAEVLIEKQRNGPTGKVELAFIDKCTSFRNLYTE